MKIEIVYEGCRFVDIHVLRPPLMNSQLIAGTSVAKHNIRDKYHVCCMDCGLVEESIKGHSLVREAYKTTSVTANAIIAPW